MCRVKDASPIAAQLPEDILKRILCMAFPLHGPLKQTSIDFEFRHCQTMENASRFTLFQFNTW